MNLMPNYSVPVIAGSKIDGSQLDIVTPTEQTQAPKGEILASDRTHATVVDINNSLRLTKRLSIGNVKVETRPHTSLSMRSGIDPAVQIRRIKKLNIAYRGGK